MSELVVPRYEVWAQYYTVDSNGYADCDGEIAIRPSREETKRIASRPDQVDKIAWINFSLLICDEDDTETFELGDSNCYIATSKRNRANVNFEKVTKVLKRDRLPRHTIKWLGWLIYGDQTETPNMFYDLKQRYFLQI
ncbi:MAG TPA: hypothetical protein VLF63_01040 [Patescibacteria group bacterium]|nr:hypothetical protein [Patescibacteria group bacterium]